MFMPDGPSACFGGEPCVSQRVGLPAPAGCDGDYGALDLESHRRLMFGHAVVCADCLTHGFACLTELKETHVEKAGAGHASSAGQSHRIL